jgi:hypothetical protein
MEAAVVDAKLLVMWVKRASQRRPRVRLKRMDFHGSDGARPGILMKTNVV